MVEFPLEINEHTRPALLYFFLPFGVIVFVLGAVGIVAVIVGDFERRWKLAWMMAGLVYIGFEMARRAWKGIVKKRAPAERTG
jgi:hypothetical protein